jgi:hypothetical protein
MEIYSERLKAVNENIGIHMLVWMRHACRLIQEGYLLDNVLHHYNLYGHTSQIYNERLLIYSTS